MSKDCPDISLMNYLVGLKVKGVTSEIVVEYKSNVSSNGINEVKQCRQFVSCTPSSFVDLKDS